MAKKKPVITLIGAGSRIFGFNMCTDLCQTPELKGATVRLVDVDEEKLDSVRRFFEIVSENTGMGLSISAHADRRKALPGSDFVVLSVARERITRWETDLEISRRHGIVEVQAECGGPGGLSLTLRNIPLVLEIARDVERLAPKAVVLNYSNPMVRVCTSIMKYTKLRTIGLCHQVLFGQKNLSRVLGRPIIVQGCGTNHFNWIYGAKWADTKKNAWPAIVEALDKDPDMPEFKYCIELFRIFGWFPSAGDQHLSEYLYHWRAPAVAEAMAGSQAGSSELPLAARRSLWRSRAPNGLNPRYNLHAKNMQPYHDGEARWEQRMGAYLGEPPPSSEPEKRDSPSFPLKRKRGQPLTKNPMDEVKGLSGEGAIPILTAMFGLKPSYHEIAANLPNKGYIADLPKGACVEVAADVSKGRIVGTKAPKMPTGIRSMMMRNLDIVELAVEAAAEGSYRKALQALAIDPIIPDLQVARSILDDILKAHADLLPAFK
jgi:alpha-galactosidase